MRNKTTIILSILVIILCLGLSVKMIIESRQYSCDKCEVHFKSKLFMGDYYSTVNKSIIDLYQSYINENCLVSWDRTQGYISPGVKR